jgi:hypothetical protein
MDLHAGGDLSFAIDDHGFAGQHFAVDLVQGLGRITAGGRAHAAALAGVDCADVRLGIVERPLDALQLFALAHTAPHSGNP